MEKIDQKIAASSQKVVKNADESSWDPKSVEKSPKKKQIQVFLMVGKCSFKKKNCPLYNFELFHPEIPKKKNGCLDSK